MVYWKCACDNIVKQANQYSKSHRTSKEKMPHGIAEAYYREGRGGVNGLLCRKGRVQWVSDQPDLCESVYSLALCELLLTKISIPSYVCTKCLTERSGEECEPVAALSETGQNPVAAQPTVWGAVFMWLCYTLLIGGDTFID